MRLVGWVFHGGDLVYTVHIRYFKQGNHHTYGHTRCWPTLCMCLADWSQELWLVVLLWHNLKSGISCGWLSFCGTVCSQA
jgi:hypothetical protein